MQLLMFTMVREEQQHTTQHKHKHKHKYKPMPRKLLNHQRHLKKQPLKPFKAMMTTRMPRMQMPKQKPRKPELLEPRQEEVGKGGGAGGGLRCSR